MFNESFWLALSIVIFACLVFKQVKSFILDVLEKKILSIDNKFKEILAIGEESEALLKDYKALYKSSEKKTKEILSSAELEIEQLKVNARLEISSKLKARTENVLNKIHNNELKTLAEMRVAAVNLAISASVAILASDKDNNFQDQCINASIDAISSQFKGNLAY